VEPKITEEEISTLVDRFYAKVRLDLEIGPIFNAIVDDWPHHLALLKNFWSTVLLTTGRYKGDPMMRHLQLPSIPATSSAGSPSSPKPQPKSCPPPSPQRSSTNRNGSQKTSNSASPTSNQKTQQPKNSDAYFHAGSVHSRHV
jgi:hypothetical protein